MKDKTKRLYCRAGIRLIPAIAAIIVLLVACNNNDTETHTCVWGDWERVGTSNVTRRICTVEGCQEDFTGGSRVHPTSTMNMVFVPGGSFRMGSPDDELGRFGNPGDAWYEGPQRRVTLSDFYMGRTTVTRGQWRAVLGAGTVQETSWGGVGDDDYPATHVSWYEAIVFANRLSMERNLSPAYRIQGSTDPDNWSGGTIPTASDADWDAVEIVPGSTGYRLPTEAQWEYAARAGTRTAFNDGVTNDWNDTVSVGALGWFWGHPDGNSLREVGLRTPNAWGLYDMHGNVWEWAWDWLGEYPSAAQTNPVGPDTGVFRVLRGGSWGIDAQNLRSARRVGNDPWFWLGGDGFRLVRP